MTTGDPPPPVTLPAITVILLAELLTQLDDFLRSSPLAADDLADFLGARHRASPDFSANNLIDDVSFTAAHLRAIASGIDRHAAEHAHIADYLGEDFTQD
ncbi:MAG: hypothetical protein M0030_24490 [Actinomycetota bacterium]|nr:hypothetical protein [Actinomycetota bacterium]